MADFTASEAAEILLALRGRLIKIFAIVAIGWTIVFALIADPLITKLTELAPEGAKVIYITPLEGLILKLKISLTFGFVAAIPYILHLSYRTLKERTSILNNVSATKSTAIKYGIVSIVLFAMGIAYGYFILRLFLQFLYKMAESQGVLALYTISEFINFVVLMLTVFGVIFQMPLVMLFLVGNDLVKFSTLAYYRKHFYIAFFVLGAAITPPDVFTQCIIALPMILFFEISLIFIRVIHRKKIKKL